MKIVMLAGGGGSGGLKGYIKGFLSACYVLEDVTISVICTQRFSEYIKDTLASNVKLIINEASGNRLIDYIKKKPLDESIIQQIDDEHPDIVYFMSNILSAGAEKYINIIGMHNQLYIDKIQLHRQKYWKLQLSLQLHRHFALKSMKKADAVIFESQYSMQQCIDHKIKFKKGIAIHYGVVESERLDFPKSISLHAPIRLLYISTIFPYKNQIRLIHGIAELKSRGYKFTLDLVGSGPDRYVRQVKKVIAKLDLTNQVVLHNWVEHDKVKDMIDQSDIFVYASSIETSGFGLMEGMARGAVIACNQESCLPEILGDGGLLFDVNSPSSIANTLQRLIDDPILRAELSQKAYHNSLQYTWENHNRKLFDELQQWLKERQKT